MPARPRGQHLWNQARAISRTSATPGAQPKSRSTPLPVADTAWATPQENIEIVRRVYTVLREAAGEAAVSRLLKADLVDPDSELDLRTAYPDGGVVRLATMSEFFDTLPWGRSVQFEPESFRAAGADRVLAFVRLHAVGTESGVPIEGRVAHLITLRDKRIVRAEVYFDRTRALEAAGLRDG